MLGPRVASKDGEMGGVQRSFLRGSRAVVRRQLRKITRRPKGSVVSASLLTCSQIASTAFTWGTVSVLPFYALMVFAPRASLTKKVMENHLPYATLGILYAYLLLLSWTPDTLGVIFATKHFLPELPSMLKMFGNEMTMASAWIHLLAVDLYAARQVYHDGLKNNVETRHSIALCLFFCPIGILSHIISKVLIKATNES
ncbi:hypothetical protein AXF42_Ash005426 [Apostasia shenzhenica]|uniref:Protein ABA DEFICIENT 4, chloroplastic n=1 Tax=Apostasia shenzhenica TaxID=1088818 RepID=A0A2I0B6Y9_9ASPA|nr:hypothetical protein AXF42_Ash005426 [Apostasia shenzhenica]